MGKIAAIEFAGDEVRLALVQVSSGPPKALALLRGRALYETPEGRNEALIAVLTGLLKDLKGSPVAYVLCVSSAYTVARAIRIPFRGSNKVASAVRFELEPYLAFPIDELSVDYSHVLEADGQTDVLAVGVRRTVIEEQLAILQAAGIDPEGIDLDVCGLAALWTTVSKAPKGLRAVLLARDEGLVFAVTYNKNLAYYRNIGITLAQVRAHPDAAIREVVNSLRSFQAGWRGPGEVESVTVTGGEMMRSLREPLEGELDVPVDYMDLIAAVKAGPLAQGEAGDGAGEGCWEGLIGLAAGAEGRGPSMNFRRGDLAYLGTVQGMLSHVMVACCLVLLLLVGVAGYYHLSHLRNLDRIREVGAKVEELDKQVADLKLQGLSVPMDLMEAPGLLDVLKEVAEKMPDSKANVAELRIDRGEGTVPWLTIKGTVKDDQQFAQASSDLKGSTLFAVDDPELKMEGGKSSFTIKAHRANATSTAGQEPGDTGSQSNGQEIKE